MVVILLKQVVWNQITARTKNAFYSELLIYLNMLSLQTVVLEIQKWKTNLMLHLQVCRTVLSTPPSRTFQPTQYWQCHQGCHGHPPVYIADAKMASGPRFAKSSSPSWNKASSTARCVLQNEPPQHASIMPSHATFSCLMGSPADTAWEGSLHATPSGSGLLWYNLGSGSEMCGCWGGRHAGTQHVLQPKSHLQDAFQGMTVGTSSSKTHSRASTFCLFHRRTNISSVLFVSPV